MRRPQERDELLVPPAFFFHTEHEVDYRQGEAFFSDTSKEPLASLSELWGQTSFATCYMAWNEQALFFQFKTRPLSPWTCYLLSCRHVLCPSGCCLCLALASLWVLSLPLAWCGGRRRQCSSSSGKIRDFRWSWRNFAARV